MKYKKRKKKEEVRIAMGFAWYRREQWPRLLEVAEDAAMLEKTYDEWLELADRQFKTLTIPGAVLKKVDVDVEELVAWCAQRELAVNGSARSQFAAEKLQEMAKKTGIE